MNIFLCFIFQNPPIYLRFRPRPFVFQSRSQFPRHFRLFPSPELHNLSSLLNIVAGCGNGKYLNVNTSIFNMGGDKSMRLTEVAREKENEVSGTQPEIFRILYKLIERSVWNSQNSSNLFLMILGYNTR